VTCGSGTYTIDVKYADMDISGSPFCVHVFDPCQVRVGAIPQGILGKCLTFERKSYSFYAEQACAIVSLLCVKLLMANILIPDNDVNIGITFSCVVLSSTFP